jgi:4-amino-4-deoxy-L-arabinose transferase-like glycosyltransferase
MKLSTDTTIPYRKENDSSAPLNTDPVSTEETASQPAHHPGERRPQLWMALLLIAAFAWRMIGLTEQSFWRDEVDVIFLSMRPLQETFSMFISPAQNGPLYYLLIRPWLFLAGSNEFALRYTSVLFGTLAVVLVWQVGRRLLPGGNRFSLDNGALLAAIFLAMNPYQLWYSQEGKMYALVMCLTLLSTWSWLEAMRRGGASRWLLYLLVTTISIYTHLMTALILPLHLLWFLLAWPLNRQRWQGYTFTLMGFVLPYLPLVWWQWHYLTTLDYQTGYAFTPFDEVLRVLLLGHTRGAFVNAGTVWLVPIFFVGLAGLLVGVLEMRASPQPTREDLNDPLLPVRGELRLLMIVAWLIVPVLLIHGVSLIKPIFVDRYVIWISSALMLLLALGVRIIHHSGGRWATLLALMLISYIGGFWLWTGWQQTYIPNKTQLRQAITYVAKRRQPDELLILQIPHTHLAYRYYTSDFGADPFADSEMRLAPWFEGLWTNNSLPDDQAYPQVSEIMAQRTEGYGDVWVLLVEAGFWDPRRLMDRWLDTNGELLERINFHGIEARHYRLQ